MKDQIKKFVDQGFKIFSCNMNKTPAMPKGFKAATNDPKEIYKQFYKQDMLIGLPCGNINNLVVIDIDIKDGRSVDDLKEELKQYGELPPTFEVETMNGGRHLYYKTSNTRLRSAVRFFEKTLPVDIRAEGGYCVTFDYKHYFPLDYEDDSNIRSLMAELPEWVENYKKPNEYVENAEPPVDLFPASEVRELRSALAFLDADDRDLWVRMGHACKSVGSVQAKGLWVEWSMKSDKFDPIDTEKKWETFQPHDITIASVFGLAKQQGWVTTYERKEGTTSGVLPQTQIIIPAWITNNFGLDLTKELLAELEKMPAPDPGGRCYFLHLDYPVNGCVMITARTGKGKSTSLANCIRELLKQGKSVLVLSIEEPFALAFSRLAQSFGYEMAYNEGVSIDDFPNYSWLGRFNAFKAEDQWIRKGAEIVKKYISSGQLRIIDATITDSPRNVKNFFQALKLNQGKHIITLDYIQLLDIGGRRNFEVWGDIAGKIIESMAQGKTLLIAAAQLNRLGSETSATGLNYDPSAEQLRESASLEQLASFIIGGGEQDGVQFYKLMKDRFSQIGAGKYLSNNTPLVWMEKNYLLPNPSDWKIEKTSMANTFINQKSNKTESRNLESRSATPLSGMF